MASKITRYLRELAEVGTEFGRQAWGYRMASLTGRVSDFADRLRNGRAGRLIGHLMERFRSEESKSSSPARRRGKASAPKRGASAASAPSSRSAASGARSAPGSTRANPRRSSAASATSDLPRPAAAEARTGGSRATEARSEKNRGSVKAEDTRARGRTPASTRGNAGSHAEGSTARASSRNKKSEGSSRSSSRTSH